jgi:hypothetical protein
MNWMHPWNLFGSVKKEIFQLYAKVHSIKIFFEMLSIRYLIFFKQKPSHTMFLQKNGM